MRDVDDLLDEVYSGQERMTRDDIYRRAVAAGLPAEVIVGLDALPEGEYAQDEVSDSLAQIGEVNAVRATGVSASDLPDPDLLRELAELHRTRHETLRYGADQALDRHDERTTQLEAEYLRRFPDREVDPDRMREGARQHRGGAALQSEGGSDRIRPADRTEIQPLEETQEVELAVGDEGPVPALAERGGSPPAFREPGAAAAPADAPDGIAGPGPRGSARTSAPRTGAEQPWDPEDLAVAEGHDPTPRHVERARQEMVREGRSTIDRTVP
jgi:hypothetical protein